MNRDRLHFESEKRKMRKKRPRPGLEQQQERRQNEEVERKLQMEWKSRAKSVREREGSLPRNMLLLKSLEHKDFTDDWKRRQRKMLEVVVLCVSGFCISLVSLLILGLLVVVKTGQIRMWLHNFLYDRENHTEIPIRINLRINLLAFKCFMLTALTIEEERHASYGSMISNSMSGLRRMSWEFTAFSFIQFNYTLEITFQRNEEGD